MYIQGLVLSCHKYGPLSIRLYGDGFLKKKCKKGEKIYLFSWKGKSVSIILKMQLINA